MSSLPPPLYAAAPTSVTFKKLRKRILRQTQDAIERYAMITPKSEGRKPKWLVCLSGGKDSHALLAALLDLQWQGALPVELLACNLDQGQPGFPKDVFAQAFGAFGGRLSDHHRGHLLHRYE